MKNKIIRRFLTNNNPVLEFVAENISTLTIWVEVLVEAYEMEHDREPTKSERDASVERMLRECYPAAYAELGDLHDLLFETVGALYDLTRRVQCEDIETGFAWVDGIGMCKTRNGEPIDV